MLKPWIIAVSGLMGSGKTTLARGIARTLGWSYIPENMPATQYLTDLFNDTRRWAFETQSAFLIHKSIQILNAIEKKQNIIIDRSLFEDANIFAEYFHHRGDIDDRSFETYQTVARHFISEIPKPDLVILCSCSVEMSASRIKSRGREFQSLYPANHLAEINECYKDWIESYDETFIYSIDSEIVDWRQPNIIDEVAEEVISILESQQGISSQPNLFDIEAKGTKFLRSINGNEISSNNGSELRPRIKPYQKVSVTQYPSAYIAAPFTAKADVYEYSEQQQMLFENSKPHGKIKRGKYRNLLLNIEKTLREFGIFSMIPHRDINKWGDRSLSAKMVADLCTEYVFKTDMFVGLVGQSHGSHYEFGLANGLRKPCILIRCKEIPSSFIIDGIDDSLGNILILECEKMSDILVELSSVKTRQFLSQFFNIDAED